MGGSVTDTDMGYAMLSQCLRSFADSPVDVDAGVLASAGSTLVKIAVINEKGGGHVPSRPFMGNTWEKNKRKYDQRLMEAVYRLEIGRSKIEAKLSQLGADMVRDIQETIDAGVNPPNAASTLRYKKGSTPLVDSGKLRNSIAFRVGKRK